MASQPEARRMAYPPDLRENRRRANHASFTLVEVMIAVFLLALLMAVAVPHFGKAREESRKKQAEADLEMLSSAILQLAWDTGAWPGGLNRSQPQDAECWDLSTASAGLWSADSRFSNWKGPYLSELPQDPWGMPYFFDPDYTVSGVYRVVVGSFGPNKVGRNVYDKDNLYILLDDR